MTKTFKKLAVAGAVSAALGAGGGALASMEGLVAEAFLVPLVFYDVSGNAPTLTETDTLITIYAPGTVGQDTIPNDYTAPHTTAGGNYTFPGTAQTYHWFFFNARSSHVLDRTGTLTANDMDVLSWRGISTAAVAGVPGYMVVSTDTATRGEAADWAMSVEAALLFNQTDPVAAQALRIPTYGMSDGADTANDAPRIRNECVYNAAGIPGGTGGCSPLITGIRANNGDGSADLVVLVQMYLDRSSANADTFHVYWFDNNDAGRREVPVVHYDDNENDCSGTYNLENELNIVLIDWDSVNSWTADNLTTTADNNAIGTGTGWPVCTPAGFAGDIGIGFTQAYIPEQGDAGGGVDSALAAFAITSDTAVTVTSPGFMSGGSNYRLRLGVDLGKQ